MSAIRFRRVKSPNSRFLWAPRRPHVTLPLATHFAFGAGVGALLHEAGATRTNRAATLGAIAVWLGSYLGWVPGLRLLRPLTQHPVRRNLLMLAVHAVWGVAAAAAARELEAFRDGPIAGGPLRDAPGRQGDEPR
jgi:hypothetical protein